MRNRRETLYFNVNELPVTLTLREAAIYLRTSTASLKAKAQKGAFPAYKLDENGKWLVDREDMLRHIQRLRETYQTI